MGWHHSAVLLTILLYILPTPTKAQCPWRKTVPELNNMCVCVVDDEQKLSVQCTDANFPLLMTNLHKMTRSSKMDLLYVNSSDVGVLNSRIFDGLHIENIQFSYCRIYNISDQAFMGLKNSLENLNLQGNRLDVVPTAALSELQRLQLLDLSGNHITTVPDDAFADLNLVTLKIGDNELQLSENTFRGLEKTLKNLNLKGSGLKELPSSISNLPSLAFLDLAQNEIRSLAPGSLQSLDALAALNLERNLLQDLPDAAFRGVDDTLSSLSLLNNLLSSFPLVAVNSLPQLRVLDIGFNLLEELPKNAFHNVKTLTLLALDGNQLSTISEEAFMGLTGSLKGLSVGGKFLNCDCKISWIVEWIQSRNLQVTSRERNPQFCGSPAFLRERSLYQLREEDLQCVKNSTRSFQVSTSVSLGAPSTPEEPSEMPAESPSKPKAVPTTETPKEKRIPTYVPVRRGGSGAGTKAKVEMFRPDRRSDSVPPSDSSREKSNLSHNQEPSPPRSNKSNRRGGFMLPGAVSDEHHSSSSDVATNEIPGRKPQLVRHPDSIEEQEASRQFGSQDTYIDEVIIQDAYRKDNAVIIQWDSEVSNILGFRVVYRLFGDKQFKLGPPLASSEREFKIRNVPTQECIVVCVVSLEDINVTPQNVPYPQCREIRTEDSSSTHMDTIIIAASSAICGTVIIAVIVFICCNRRRGSSRNSKEMIPNVITQSAAPLASLGTLGGVNGVGGGVKGDWDTLSMYSQRSIPRARMYHMDKGNINGGFIPDDVQSHISAASLRPHSRAMAEAGLAPLSLSRPDLRMSRQSLAGLGYNGLAGPGLIGMGGMNLNAMGGMNGLGGMNTLTSLNRAQSGGQFSRGPSTRSRHSRSKSRDRNTTSSRLSHAGSSHSLTGYDDSEGWTDHDMDIYMARNPTRGGLVQL